jgi:uncharacterized protein
MIARILILVAFLFAAPAMAVDFPPLSGRVVDQADLLNPEQEQQLTQRLEALQRASSRQLVVATVPSLQDLPIEDYGYQLGRAWGLGQQSANNGIILLVAPTERKVRIEVGYGLEGIVTDALSNQIINRQILPHFRANDYAGGVMAGAEALIQQLQAPPEAAEQAAVAAQQAENRAQPRGRHRNRGSAIGPLIIWGLVFLFIAAPALGAGLAGRRYRGRRGVSVWGPDDHRGSGLGWMLAGIALSNLNRGGGGSSWGGGGGSSWGGGGGGGGGGGFSGGGGSFGGGGASGGW